MKNIFKKNQMIITALAIMIAVAGYLNYSGSRLDSAKVSGSAEAQTEESDAEAAADISAEDIYAQTGLEELQFADKEIASLDQDPEDLDAAASEETETAEVDETEEPGEAVLASSSTAGVGIAAEAKVTREQLRCQHYKRSGGRRCQYGGGRRGGTRPDRRYCDAKDRDCR